MVMNLFQRSAFCAERDRARALMKSGDLDAAFVHLERAHVIGQADVVPHVTTHWLMLRVELRRCRLAALCGQALRIVLGATGSAVGIVPSGNTGGTNVSLFRRMPIERELQSIIDGVGPFTPHVDHNPLEEN